MKTIEIDIVYGHSIKQRHGLNYVTNTLVKGNPIFRKHGMQIRNIYSVDGVYDCLKKGEFFSSTKSAVSNIKTHFIKKKLSNFLKKEFLLFEILRYLFHHYLLSIKTVNQYIRHNNSDIIIFQDFISASIYYKKRVEHNKGILIMHTSKDILEHFRIDKPAMYKNRIIREWYVRKFKFAASKVEKIVVLSHEAFNSFPFIPDKKKVIIYNGIEELPEKPISENISVSSKKINIITVGTVNKRKGQLEVINAISMLTKAERSLFDYYVVGGGPELEHCMQITKELGLDNIIFLGERSDVPNILISMDVFILASKSEGLPISIIEALRAGLYIMTTDVGGCREMINNEIGVLIGKESHEIANALSCLLKNGIDSEVRIKSKEQFFKYFSLEQMISSYAQIITSIQ
jgi:glycosyltransferase involved in cell wall biosynthesis